MLDTEEFDEMNYDSENMVETTYKRNARGSQKCDGIFRELKKPKSQVKSIKMVCFVKLMLIAIYVWQM